MPSQRLIIFLILISKSYILTYSLESQVLPTMQIINFNDGAPWENIWEVFDDKVKGNTNIIAKRKHHLGLALLCSAPYPIEVQMETSKVADDDRKLAKNLRQSGNFQYLNDTFYVRNVSFTFQSKLTAAIEIVVCQGFGGTIRKTINIFLPGEKILLNSGKTIILDGSSNWIPCLTTDPRIPISLHINENNRDTVKIHAIYDVVNGFYFKAEAASEIVCFAGGNDKVHFIQNDTGSSIDNHKEQGNGYTFMILMITTVTILVVSLVIFRFGIYRNKIANNFRTKHKQGIQMLLEWRTDLTDILSLSHDLKQLPNQDEFEISEEDVSLDYTCELDLLGLVLFGTVVKGYIKSQNITIAAKFIHGTTDLSNREHLISEIKILANIRHHNNIVRLVGFNTEDIRKGTLHMYVEFCKLGSLKDYLQNARANYINPMAEYQNIFPSNNGIASCNMLDLIRWSAEIASGLEYLSNKLIIHMDLAARSILIHQDRTAKIGGFSGSKQLDKDEHSFVLKEMIPVPWRWMAPESLRQQEFSTQSNVWSYGVTIWEIFSLGEDPYPQKYWTQTFVEKLSFGNRNAAPKFANSIIYSKMLQCWSYDPSERPRFKSLREYFYELNADLVSSSVYAIPLKKF